MSVHDWSSKWFHHHVDDSPADPAGVETDRDPSALGEALDRRDAEVTPLFAKQSRGAEPARGTTGRAVSRPSQRELDPEPDAGLNQDLAALSRVILNLPVEATPPGLTAEEPTKPRGARVRLDAVPDEAPLVPAGVVGGARARREPEVAQPAVPTAVPEAAPISRAGARARRDPEVAQPAAPTTEPETAPTSRAGARARRDVPPLVGAPTPGEMVVPRGKHAAGWADETPETPEAPEALVDADELTEAVVPEISEPPAAGADFDWPVIDSWPVPEEPAAPPTQPEWSAPAVPFELEPEPEVDVEPLRWVEPLDVGAPVEAPELEAFAEPVAAPMVEPVIDPADDVFRWTAAEAELPLEVPDLSARVQEAEPEPQVEPEPVALAKPEPEPAPLVSWDSMAVAPKIPAARPVQSSAALLRELSFLD